MPLFSKAYRESKKKLDLNLNFALNIHFILLTQGY